MERRMRIGTSNHQSRWVYTGNNRTLIKCERRRLVQRSRRGGKIKWITRRSLTEWTQTIIDCHDNGFAVTSKDSAIEGCPRTRLISIAMNEEQHRKTFYRERERCLIFFLSKFDTGIIECLSAKIRMNIFSVDDQEMLVCVCEYGTGSFSMHRERSNACLVDVTEWLSKRWPWTETRTPSSSLTLNIFHRGLIDIHVQTLLFILFGDVSQQFRIIISHECLRVHSNEFTFIAPEMLGTGRSKFDLFLHFTRGMKIESLFRRLESFVIQAILQTEKGFDIDKIVSLMVIVLVIDLNATDSTQFRNGQDPIR